MSDSARISRNAPDGPIHSWFSLSYANYMVLPRTLLQSMPLEWQKQFVVLLGELDDLAAALPDGWLPDAYRVNAVESGKLASLRNYRLPHYDRGRTLVSIEREQTA